MGTSVSQGSPNTNAWRAVAAAYKEPTIDPGRLAKLVWRAAGTDAQSDLGNLLAEPVIAQCFMATLNATTPNQTATAVTRLVARTENPTFATEIAKRAVLLSTVMKDKGLSFSEYLFAEATNYLVSRDISPIIGLSSRLQTVQDAARLKDDMMNQVVAVVRSVGQPEVHQPSDWNGFVKHVVARLRA